VPRFFRKLRRVPRRFKRLPAFAPAAIEIAKLDRARIGVACEHVVAHERLEPVSRVVVVARGPRALDRGRLPP
jgi:hypothetical protein